MARPTEVHYTRLDDNKDSILDKFDLGPLGKYAHDAKLLFDLIQDYRAGRYTQVPIFSVGAAVFTLLYLVMPFDFVPDFIPFLGQLDDLAVVALCLKIVQRDLHKYEKWKLRQA